MSNNESIDLAAYLARIGLDGTSTLCPTLDTLRSVLMAHACSIPFENLDVLLKRPMRLDQPSLRRKLVVQRRGGYCFEQNTLLLEVLQAMGFQARGLSARVRFAASRDETPSRTHLFCEVTLDGERWIADVGVGGLTPTAPIRIDTETPQETPHDTRRVQRDRDTGHWFHQIHLPDGWRDVCEFTGEEMPMIDRQVAHWWTSTSPESKFRQSIMGAIAQPDGSRRILSTRQFTIRNHGQEIEKIHIQSSGQLLTILSEQFGLDFDCDTLFGVDGL